MKLCSCGIASSDSGNWKKHIRRFPQHIEVQSVALRDQQPKIVQQYPSEIGEGVLQLRMGAHKMDDDPLADLLAPSVARTVEENVDLRSVRVLSAIPSH